MFGKRTLRNAAYVGIVAVILALMDVYSSFGRKDVITDFFNFSQLLFYVTLFAGGLVAARGFADRGVMPAVVNGVLGGLVVSGILAALLAFADSVNFDDLRFIFPNLSPLSGSTLMQGQAGLLPGLFLLIMAGALVGGLAGFISQLPMRVQNTIFGAVAAVVIIGVLQGQINRVVTLGDATAIAVTFIAAYLLTNSFGFNSSLEQLLLGLGIGIGGAIIFGLVASLTGMERDTLLRGSQQFSPTLLMLPLTGDLLSLLIFGGAMALFGVLGAVMTSASKQMHDASWYFIAIIVSLGLLASQKNLTIMYAIIITVVMGLTFAIIPTLSQRANTAFFALPRPAKAVNRRVFYITVGVILLVVPPFMGLSLTNTLNLVMIYIIMGVGMNVMIGYAGLLDLGYVASFAIGAYTAGILTSPSILTCPGMVNQAGAFDALRAFEDSVLGLQQICPNLLTFWEAWPIAIIVSAFTGMMLGVPVLRLRGDYLAIVTLGFGEILQRIISSSTFKPIFGGPQGIQRIPVPTLFGVELARSTEVYYLFLLVVALGALVVLRLASSRLGRAWRALRDDEDVAEAMGINLTVAKLLAFGVSSAFSGMGGALFGASLQGIFPNSFVLLVSINVLSLVILGGMGGIPGVFIGAFVLVGMPEILRELRDYRLLAFGVLLVVTMLLRPEGLIPPQPPKLSEQSTAHRKAEAAAEAAGD